METRNRLPIPEQYINYLRGCKSPCFSVLLAIDGITECPNQKGEILDAFREKIKQFGTDHLNGMEKTVFDLSEKLKQNLDNAGMAERHSIQRERRISCLDVYLVLHRASLQI